MKKLMIAAATAAIVGGAFAINQAQVYDFTASLKTTKCQAAKVSAALERYFEHTNVGPSVYAGQFTRNDEIGLRKQTTVKLAGVIWGCDCPTISMPDWRPTNNRYLGGYLFWNQTTEELYNPDKAVTRFTWHVLNRIDAMTKVEGVFRFYSTQLDQTIFLLGAGFGTVTGTGCDTVVSSMSGNLAGYGAGIDGQFGCVFCAANDCIVTPVCDTCVDRNTTRYTVGYGTWKIKFNKAAANRLARVGYISSAYSFKKAGITQAFMTQFEKAYALNPEDVEDAEDAEDPEAVDIADLNYGDYITTETAGGKKKWKHEGTVVDADYDNSGLVSDVLESEAFLNYVESLPDSKYQKVPNWMLVGTEEDSDFAELIADLS